MLPVNDYTERSKMFFPLRSPAQILELNRWIKDYAARNGCIYLDYFSAMVDDKGLLKRDLADDGLHPERSWLRRHGSAGAEGDRAGARDALTVAEKRRKSRFPCELKVREESTEVEGLMAQLKLCPFKTSCEAPRLPDRSPHSLFSPSSAATLKASASVG